MCVGVLIDLCCVFFFQAEDGIRDLVRSRGLGDVYKRQLLVEKFGKSVLQLLVLLVKVLTQLFALALCAFMTVSYTHLTLPTSDLV